MPSIVKILKVVAEPNRLRILLLLRAEELSVAELQEILTMGQSTISTHLSQLKNAGLVEDRRTGKSSLYRLTTSGGGAVLDQLLDRAKSEIPEAAADRLAMRGVIKKRQDKMRSFFDSVAGRLGKDYVPGKSWKSIAEALLRLMPPMVIADLGAGEGAFSLLLAQRAKKVIAVDTSAKMSFASATWKRFPSRRLQSTLSGSRNRCTTRCIPAALWLKPTAFCDPAAASLSSTW